jgi:quercetin dioxygenase-like cupin family protein
MEKAQDQLRVVLQRMGRSGGSRPNSGLRAMRCTSTGPHLSARLVLLSSTECSHWSTSAGRPCGVMAGPGDSVTLVIASEIDTMNTSGKTAAMALAAIVLGAMAAPALAQGTSDKEVFINSKDIKWGDAPPSIPKGAKLAVLQGDPGKPGPFVIRLMLPPGFKLPPHAHSQDESLTVISGTFYFGTGDKIEMSKAHALNAGGFHALSAGDHHYAFAKAQTVVQVNGMGPFNITYINPDDDPQKAKK